MSNSYCCCVCKKNKFSVCHTTYEKECVMMCYDCFHVLYDWSYRKGQTCCKCGSNGQEIELRYTHHGRYVCKTCKMMCTACGHYDESCRKYRGRLLCEVCSKQIYPENLIHRNYQCKECSQRWEALLGIEPKHPKDLICDQCWTDSEKCTIECNHPTYADPSESCWGCIWKLAQKVCAMCDHRFKKNQDRQLNQIGLVCERCFQLSQQDEHFPGSKYIRRQKPCVRCGTMIRAGWQCPYGTCDCGSQSVYCESCEDCVRQDRENKAK